MTELSPPVAAAHPRLLLFLLGGLLGVAVLLQNLPYPAASIVQRDLPLSDYLPDEILGWIGEDRPLAETESLAGAVKSIINYDEALLRFYRKGGREFSVYLAYWQPGKMPSREIAFHIPDKCWISVGWKRTAADYAQRRELDGLALAPGQYREFEANDRRQYVLYWHIFNGRTILYNPDGSPGDLTIITDLWRRGLRQKGEQYFIRIASSSPLDTLWSDAGFQEILALIAPLGPGLNPELEYFEAPPPSAVASVR